MVQPKLSADEYSEWLDHPVGQDYMRMLEELKMEALAMMGDATAHEEMFRCQGRYHQIQDIIDGLNRIRKGEEKGGKSQD